MMRLRKAQETTPQQLGLETGTVGSCCCRVPVSGTDRAPTSRSALVEGRDHLLEGVDDFLLYGLGDLTDVADLQATLEALHVLAQFPEDLGEGDRDFLRLQHVDG